MTKYLYLFEQHDNQPFNDYMIKLLTKCHKENKSVDPAILDNFLIFEDSIIGPHDDLKLIASIDFENKIINM